MCTLQAEQMSANQFNVRVTNESKQKQDIILECPSLALVL